MSAGSLALRWVDVAGGAFRLAGGGQVEALHVADETWINASPDDVGAAVADPTVWSRFWPDLQPRLTEGRDAQGVRLDVVSDAWRGTAELYIHPEFEGALLFHFLRLDPAPGHRLHGRALDRERHRRSAIGRRTAWTIKDELEGRTAGRR